MLANAALPQPLFAPPRIIAEAADSGGAIVLRSAEPLGEYPVSVASLALELLDGVTCRGSALGEIAVPVAEGLGRAS